MRGRDALTRERTSALNYDHYAVASDILASASWLGDDGLRATPRDNVDPLGDNP